MINAGSIKSINDQSYRAGTQAIANFPMPIDGAQYRPSYVGSVLPGLDDVEQLYTYWNQPRCALLICLGSD